MKLLRVLQEKKITRLGSTEENFVDTRIIAATNIDIKNAVRENKFREDLYYRLAVFPIELLPLRERAEDIPLIANYIFERLGYRYKIDETILKILKSYPWPGNVREMENVLARAIILAGSGKISEKHIHLEKPEAHPEEKKSLLSDMEAKAIEEALQKAGGNKSKAAKILGITRRMLYTRMKKHNL